MLRVTTLRASLVTLLILFGAVQAGALEDNLAQAVTEFGTLNGVVLACKQHVLTARMREIMVDTVPKERNVGELFWKPPPARAFDFGAAGKARPTVSAWLKTSSLAAANYRKR